MEFFENVGEKTDHATSKLIKLIGSVTPKARSLAGKGLKKVADGASAASEQLKKTPESLRKKADRLNQAAESLRQEADDLEVDIAAEEWINE